MATEAPIRGSTAVVGDGDGGGEWQALFLRSDGDDRAALQAETAFAADLGRRLQALVKADKLHISSSKVAEVLYAASLCAFLSSVPVEPPEQAKQALIALNNVLALAPNAVSAALAEHGLVEAITRGLHKRIDLLHELSPVVLVVCHTLCARCEDAFGNLDILATKPDLVELAVGTVMWLGSAPERLQSQQGLAMAHRAAQICWALSKYETSASSTVESMFVSADLAGRAMHLSGLMGSPAFLEGLPDPAGPPGAKLGSTIGELCVSLAAVCSSFATAMLGLGRSLDVTSVGLHRLRSWLLSRDRLSDMHSTLAMLTDELRGSGPLLRHLRLAKEAEAAAATDREDEDAPAEGQPSRPPPALAATAALAAQEASVEGAIRNLMTVMTVPLLCSDPAAPREVTALCSFSLQYFYMIHQLGLPQLFKQLGDRKGPYRGVYLATFCAMSDLLQEGAQAIGPQFAEWGVQLDRDDPAGNLGEMFVPTSEGVDSATATAFITEQITRCVGYSQKMTKVLQLSQRAALSRQQAAEAGHQAESAAAPGPLGKCVFCGLEAGTRTPKTCKCGALYCSTTCQVAHFPKHKKQCKAAREASPDKS